MNKPVIFNINQKWLSKNSLTKNHFVIANILLGYITPESNDITSSQIKKAVQCVYLSPHTKDQRIFEIIIALTQDGFLQTSTPGKFKVNPDICFAQYGELAIAQ